MQQFSLTEVRNQHGKIFDLAMLDPVLLTKNSRPSHVVLSANDYNALIRQLEILEDKIWGERTLEAKRTGKFMGPEKFMKWLKDTEARLEREIADAEA